MHPLATWSPDRQAWVTGQIDLFSGRSEPYLETWPTSGMTRSGCAYPLLAWAHPTSVTASSSSPGTPGRSHGPGTSSTTSTGLLPTPKASDTGTAGRRAGKGWGSPLSEVLFDLTG
jgi:hypothetical protein